MTSEFFINQKPAIEPTFSEEYFCLKGSEEFIDDEDLPRLNNMSNKVLAKKVKVSDKQNRYYIRKGFDQKLYNPNNPLNSAKNYSELNRNSESIKFYLVNELAFQYYLKYLSTNNNVWLIKAEREVI